MVFAIRKAAQGQDRLPVALYVINDNRRPKLVKLIATCGALEMDDPQPAITVMMPDEDRPASNSSAVEFSEVSRAQLSVNLPVQGMKSNENYWRVMTILAWFYRGFC
ncbi:MAG: hypothetical protein ABSE48_06560 [Verrucomicrobiota bacterium]|jgi:hypothetical protein